MLQIHGYRGKKLNNENMKKRMEHDVWYMNNWSNRLDFYIIIKTLFSILKKPKNSRITIFYCYRFNIKIFKKLR